MAKDIYDKLKVIPELIKSWWVLIPMIIAAFGGGGTGIYQYFDKQEVVVKAEKTKNIAVHEVTKAFQDMLAEHESTPAPKVHQVIPDKRIKELQKRLNEFEKKMDDYHK